MSATSHDVCACPAPIPDNASVQEGPSCIVPATASILCANVACHYDSSAASNIVSHTDVEYDAMVTILTDDVVHDWEEMEAVSPSEESGRTSSVCTEDAVVGSDDFVEVEPTCCSASVSCSRFTTGLWLVLFMLKLHLILFVIQVSREPVSSYYTSFSLPACVIYHFLLFLCVLW